MRVPSERPSNDSPAAGPDAVQAARTTARRRLIGALVLLVIGVIGFPLLFETEPRPVAIDTPIVLPPRGGGPAARPAPTSPAPTTPVAPATRPETSADADGATAPRGATGPATAAAPAAPTASASRAARAEASASAPVAVARTESTTPARAPATPAPAIAAAAAPDPAASRSAVRATPASPATPAAADEAARAQALLDDKAAPRPGDAGASAGDAARFVVQVGAYTDPATLREARARVEKLGLKTYTQVVEAEGGKRTRVRVGPFASRDDANAAAGKLKGAGLPAAVFAL